MAIGLPEDLQGAYERLLIQDVRRHLPGIELEAASEVSLLETSQLLSMASHLAAAEGYLERNTAYEIATRVAALRGIEFPGLARGAELVLARLGNFPGRDLLRKRFNEPPVNEPLLQLEMRVHEIENTITDAGGRRRRLTDFQFDALSSFAAYRSVSLSAPTSAGKSFLLGLEVLRKLRNQRPAGIAFLVPTRALIRQVVVDLREIVAGSELPFPLIRSVPRIATREEASNGIVYVLTQERLLSLLNPDEGEPWLTALIVDEAQSIGDGSRGVLLHTAVEQVMKRFPKAEIIFASPLAKNPEYLLDIFSCVDSEPFREQHSPVSQNLILVESVPEEARRVSCTLLQDDSRLPLGVQNVPFRFRGVSALRRLALFARSLPDSNDPEDCCIVYANGARDAERIAQHLIRGSKPIEPIDPDIEELISYLKEFVHPDYGLAEVLGYGVAFHYSNMPGSVRAGVEDLFHRRKLRYLCCTSTLLQGVNLPARHIVMEAPKRGRDRPMERGDFLNLAGRAGRLTREFHGNVWCLRPDLWEKPCYEGERLQEIRSAFDRMLDDGGTAIRQVFEDDHRIENTGTAVAALGRIFTEFVQQDRPLETSRHRNAENSVSLESTVQLLQRLKAEVRLPPDVFARNSGIHPRRLESLYSLLSSQSELDPYHPIRPNTPGTNKRLRDIFQLVQRQLGGVENDSYTQHAKIASMWIHQNPLSKIISSEITYREAEAAQARPPKKVNVRNQIYAVIDTIEHDLRFRYVRFMRAYHDILAQVLRDRNQHTQAEQLARFHLYLENGAFRPVPISLMSLGLTRVAALLLARRIILPSDASPEECLRLCRQAISNAAGLKLPGAVRREIAALAGG